jgi:ubiquinone/menaquinone biosynthesis C-methylase UbiE
MTFDVRTQYQDIQEAEQYDARRFSSLSGRVFQWAERRALRRALDRLSSVDRLLDGPCGTGRLMDLFLRRGARVIGADISAQMIAVARRRTAGWNGRVTFARMDFLRMPLRGEAVDAVFCIRFLPHIPPAERVSMLRELARVSRRWVVLTLSISTPWHRARRTIKAWLGHWKPVRHPATSRAIAQELAAAGLREVRRFHTFPILSEEIVLVCEKAR